MLARDRHFEWIDAVAKRAEKEGCDFFVLAPGLALGGFGDIAEGAGLSAGVGLTIELDPGLFEPGLDHVIMDFGALGHLIPQRTRVTAGGADDILAHDDPVAREGGHPGRGRWGGIPKVPS
jgi:hypothetical protein